MPGKTIESRSDRRWFLVGTASVSGVAFAGAARSRAGEDEEEDGDAEVTPGEDLMQEHGLLERLLLIYDEAARRLEQSAAFDSAVVGSAAQLVATFVEGYHEKLEEEFVFPRLE